MSRPFATALASAVLAAPLACGPAAALEAVAGTQLVMHVGPGAEHRSIATIPAEARLTVHGCAEHEGWCLVRFGGRHGWIEGESLNLVGVSRPRQPTIAAAFAPAAPEPVRVPVPAAPGALLPPFITADDVVIGMGEQFGFAAIGRSAAVKPVDLKKRHRGGLAFKRHAFKHDVHVRRHGHFKHPHLDRHGFHSGKAIHFDHRHFGRFHGHPGKGLHFARANFAKDFKVSRGRFGKRGHFTIHGKSPDRGWHIAKGHSRHHVSRAHFGKRDHVTIRGKSADRGWHVAKGHSKHRFGKHGKAFRQVGKVRFGGLRVKGGWRP